MTRSESPDDRRTAVRGGRRLVVNADDFGQSAGVNDGVLEAHARGIVTSASLMVRWEAAAAAVARSRDFPRLGIGLHLDFGEWAYRAGEWEAVYEVASTTDAAAVAEEVGKQLESFRALVGRAPTHLDSHQHVHRSDPMWSIVRAIAQELRIPVRHSGQVRYCGDFYGQAERGARFPAGIRVEHLVSIIRALPSGVTELACHPALGDDLDSMYRGERTVEVRSLCDPSVVAAIAEEGVELRSFAEVAGEGEE